MYPYRYGRSLSSVPSHLTAPNGLNFTRSINDPKSRLNRVRDYLTVRGPSTKRDILRDVFGKTFGQYPNGVTSGWGAYLFSYGVKHGFFQKVRKGNTVLWSVR